MLFLLNQLWLRISSMREIFHSLLHKFPALDRYVTTALRAKFLRARYAIDARRIRQKACEEEKIRLLFLVSEPAKWKAQSLFDILSADSRYEIVVAISIGDTDIALSREERKAKVDSIVSWFQGRGILNCVLAYDSKTDRALPLDRFQPDMVFYQQPWFIPPCQMPRVVSRYALTFYIPYFVPTFANNTMHCQLQLHKDVFRHFVLNEDWRKFYLSQIDTSSYAGDMIAVGHPFLDNIKMRVQGGSPDDYVIYAPHWSICHPKNPNELNLSTFPVFGAAMLEYAQRHPEIRWVFRPHPTLKLALQRTSLMSDAEIAKYYDAWARVGEVSLAGGYTELFNHSRALITDCDSFLSEYAVTGNPVVRLVSEVKNNRHFSPLKSLFDSYYQVRDKEDFLRILDDVIVKGNDPMRKKRLYELSRTGLGRTRSAEQIANHLHAIVEGRH